MGLRGDKLDCNKGCIKKSECSILASGTFSGEFSNCIIYVTLNDVSQHLFKGHRKL